MGRMVMWGGMGWLALEGIYYTSDSALRRLVDGERLIWLEICDDARAFIFKKIGI